MEGEFVQIQKSDVDENAEADLSRLNPSYETLKTSEVQESDQSQVNDISAVLSESNNCETSSNDAVKNGEGMTTCEPIKSPDDLMAESNRKSIDTVQSETVEGVDTGTNEEQVEVEKHAEERELPSKEESAAVESNGSDHISGTATDVISSQLVKAVEIENQDEVTVGVTDDVNAEKFPSKDEPVVVSPDEFVAESKVSGIEVLPSETVEGVETETKNQAKVRLTDDIENEEKLQSKKEPTLSSDDLLAESDGSTTREQPSEAVDGVETKIKDQVKDGLADGDINAEERLPTRDETVNILPDNIVTESNGSTVELLASETVEGAETTVTNEQVKVEDTDDINHGKGLPSVDEPVVSPDSFVSESNVISTEVSPSEAEKKCPESNGTETELLPSNVEEKFPESSGGGSEELPSGVEEKCREELPSGVEEKLPELNGSDIGALPSELEDNLTSNEDKMDDLQVTSVDSVSLSVQDSSASDTCIEKHSTMDRDGATEAAADNVFEDSAPQPPNAPLKKDGSDLEKLVVDVDPSRPTGSGEVSQCSEVQSLEVQSLESVNSNAATEGTSASEGFLQKEQIHEELEQLEKKMNYETFEMASNGIESSVVGRDGIDEDSRFTLSPMSALGTDYAKLARSHSSDSNVSEGRSSQEPVNRTQVEKVVAPEIARNVRMMFESGQIQDLHEIKKTIADLEEPTDSGIFENEPVQREGVVRSGEYVNDVDEVQKGQTKNLLNQWKDKGKEEFKADKKPINMAEDEGRVLENEPVRRSDVVREEDCDQTKELPSKGNAKILTQQWISRKDDFEKEQKPIKLFENETEPSVVENQPEVRMDVLREEDNTEEIWLRKGFTKDLAGYWAGPKEEARLAREVIDLGQEKDGVIAENEPTKLEGVVRSEDYVEEVIPIEKGRARSMVSKWSTLPEEAARQPFQLDVNTNEAGVYENNPIQLEGVVRGTSQVDEVLGQHGMIKNIAGRFLQTDEVPRNRKEMIVIDKAEGPSVLENDPEPVRADVVRGEYSDEVQVEKGTTKNLVHKWKNQDQTPIRSADRLDPSSILETERATESGVFENQPQERADVFREAAYEPEVISVKETRSTRAMWSKMGLDDGQKPDKAPQLVRFTPPRELTPPRVHQEEFKSYQALTLSSDSTLTSCGPSPPVNNSNNRPTAANQPRSPVYSPGGSNYAAPSPSGDQTLTSSAMFVLKSS